MTIPTNTDIDATLQRIERASSPNRELARERIEQFRLDREKEGLPTTNLTTGSGAPLLNRDEAIRKSIPDYAIIAKTAKSRKLSTVSSKNLLRRFRWLGKILTHQKRSSALPLSILKT